MKRSATPHLSLIILLALSACALLAYTITRAALLSLTPDELSTIETFGAKFIIYPETYHNMSANHHWLNSWLIFFSRSIFGDNEFAFRIPNLIAHAVYLFFTARLMLRLRKDYFAWAGFILLNAHPYMLDFFSLARGYGLAFAGFAGGIYYLHCFISENKNKHLVFALISMMLAVLANFALLSIFLLFSGILGLICLRDIKPEKRLTLRRIGIIILCCGGLLLLIMPHLAKMKAAGAFFWVNDYTFLESTVTSFCTKLLYDVPYKGKDVLRSCLPAIYTIIGVLLLFSVVAVIKKGWRDPGILLALSCITIFFGGLLAILVQRAYFGLPYPEARMSLYLFVAFIFAFVIALASLKVFPKLSAGIAFILAAPVLFHLFFCSNVHYTIEWRGSGDVDRMMMRVVEDRKNSANPNASVKVSADGEASCTISWLHYSKWKLTWLENVCCWTYDPMPQSDYYIVTKNFSSYRDKSKWKLIDSCTVSGNALYIDTASFYYRTGKAYQSKK